MQIDGGNQKVFQNESGDKKFVMQKGKKKKWKGFTKWKKKWNDKKMLRKFKKKQKKKMK